MTLILALANDEYAVQLSDRRLMSNGKLIDDESNKAGSITCDDARLVYGFTGLAEYGDFKTAIWILELLQECGPPDHLAREILERFARRASESFQSSPLLKKLPQEHKRLSIMFTGFSNDSRILNAIVTNYQNFESGLDLPAAKDEFSIYALLSRTPSETRPTMIQRVGSWKAMSAEDERSLREMLLTGKPRTAVVDKAVDLMREMATRPAAAGTIGKSISSVCLLKNSSSPLTGYHAGKPSDSLPLVDMVDLRKAGLSIAMRNITLHSPGTLISMPKVGRNQPCPCKSGKKYRHCHGK